MNSTRIRLLFGLLAGIAFLLLQVFFPDLPFTEAQTTSFFLLIAAYLVGEGLEGNRIKDNFKQMLASWKFRSLLAGVLVLVIQSAYPAFPLTQEKVSMLIEVLSALILGTGAQGFAASLQSKSLQ